MATYSTRPEDSYDSTLISPQHSIFPGDIFGTSSNASHRGSIGGLSNVGAMEDDDYAAFQSSFLDSRVPSLSPSYANGYANPSTTSPHSFSSSSPNSSFSGAVQPTDDFLFNNSFGQEDLDKLLYQDAAVTGKEPFHIPNNWSFQYPQSQPIPQQTQPQYAYQQPYSSTSLPTSFVPYNPPVEAIPSYNAPQSEADLRKSAEVANQARAAATRELEEVRRQQQVQAEQIQALQRAQQPATTWTAPTFQPSQNWGPIQPPSLPNTKPISKPVAPMPVRKGRPPKPPSSDSASPDPPGGKHNKTERRYRQKVQVAQSGLRDAVPALRVHYGTSTPEQLATTDFRAPDGTVDGLGEVSRPNASAKATILNGARLYIEVLQSRVEGMQRKVDELEAFRLAVGGPEGLERWRQEFAAKEAIRLASMVKTEDFASDSESEDEAPKKRKKAKKESNSVRVFAAFAMSFSLVPSASTLLRHQPVGDISPGHVLSGQATPTQVISRLPLITAEHVYAMATRVFPVNVVPTPGVMVDWTWRLLVAAVLVLVLGPMTRAWSGYQVIGDVVEMGKDVVKLGLGVKGEEEEEWVEYTANVLGKVFIPTPLARRHLNIRLRRTASTPYALALLALIQLDEGVWEKARAALTDKDPAPLQAVLALPFDEAKHSLSLLPTTSSPISAIAEQITLVHLNDLYSRLFTRLVDSTISQSLPISVNALLDNLTANPLKSDLSTLDQEIRDTVQGVSRGTAAHALGLVLIGLWGVFTGSAASAQASLASALAGEEINGAGLSSVSAMLELLYPGASQSPKLRLTSLPQNAIALDKLALVCIGYVRLLHTCGNTPKGDKAKMIARATADLRMVISETKFVGMDQEQGEVSKFEGAKERLVGVLSVIGRRAAGRVDAGEDSGLDADLDDD